MATIEERMQVVGNIQDMTNLMGDAVKIQLKDMIKAKLMAHAEEVVEEVATDIAEGLASQIESYNMPTGDVQVNVWLGPKEKKMRRTREVTYKVEPK